MLKRLLDSRRDIRRVFDSYSHDADGLGEFCKVRILQVRLKVGKARDLHLHFHHAKRAVVEHHELDGEVVLRDRQYISHTHRKSAVAAHCDNLPSGISELGADGLGKRVRHGPVSEGTDQPAIFGWTDIPRRPDVAHPSVGRKDRIGSRKFAQSGRHGLRVHGRPFTNVVHVNIQSPNCFFLPRKHRVQERAI